MAGAGWRDFVPGEVLTAANVQDYLQDQSVMVFASAAARTSALASPTEGMVSYRTDGNIVEVYDGSAWKQFGATTGGILQVQSTTNSALSTYASTTFASIMSVSITPKSTSSKILVMYSANLSVNTANWGAFLRLVRGSTSIYIGDTTGSRTRASSHVYPTTTAQVFPLSGTFVDSPSTTSATTYYVEIAAQNATYPVVVNTIGSFADAASSPALASNITVMEIAG